MKDTPKVISEFRKLFFCSLIFTSLWKPPFDMFYTEVLLSPEVGDR